MALDSMYALLMDQLQDMYHAESQLIKALPRMARAARSPALRKTIETHVAQTEDQVSRLEQVFAELGVAPRGRRCKGMEGLLDEVQDLLEEEGSEAVLDAGLIAAARRVEHYEIAAYSTLVSFAELLGERQVAAVLNASLAEESAADEALRAIAAGEVHAVAITAEMEEETGA